MGESGGDKSEQPTPHKLREARKKGQVVKSKEITTAFLFLASYYVLLSVAKKIWKNIADLYQTAWTFIGAKLEIAHYGLLLLEALKTLLYSLLPIFAVNFGIAIVIESLQSGFNLSFEPLKPKLSKINPIEGFKRLFSLKGIVELVKSIAKMGIIFFIMQKTILPEIPKILNSINLPLLLALAMIGKLAFTIAIRVGLFYILIALLDYFYQRHTFMKQMRMTKQEVKDEYKKLEGDPMVKQRQRDMARQMSSGRGGAGAAGADAVVTNPTHIAVAIKYDSEVMHAPEVVAKGKFLIAEQIKAIAKENKILVIDRPELAWAIYNSTEVGQKIPIDLYTNVAEILALVYDLRKKKQKKKTG